MALRLGLLGIAAFVTGAGIAAMAGWAEAQSPPVISQRGIAFAPAAVTVKAGGRVLFRNEDPFGHNVYSPSKGGIFDIGLQAPDSETAVSFREAGEYTIMCRIHPKMRATVTVTP